MAVWTHEARRGPQGASRAAPGNSCLHAHGEGELVITLEPWEVTRASRRVEEGLSRSFSGGGGKPSFPSTSAGDYPGTQECPCHNQLPAVCSPSAHPAGPPSPCLKRETTSGTWIHVDLAAFHRAPKPALPSHPPPWAPEIGMVTSSSFLLPPPRNSGTMVGLGPIRTQASALDMRALPPPPHTEDFSLSLQLGHHLSRAGCTGNREGSLSKSKKCSLDHLFDPCSASVTLPWPRLARNQR